MNDNGYYLEKLSDKLTLVIATSRTSPLDCLPMIENDLQKFSGKIVFDLILCNGFNPSTGMAAATCQCGKIDQQTLYLGERDLTAGIGYYRAPWFTVIDQERIDENCRLFWNKNPDLLLNRVLTTAERLQISELCRISA